MEDDEEQANELLALTSIYDKEVFTASKNSGLNEGIVLVDVEIPHPFEVVVKEKEDVRHCVENLPSIVLSFSLPHDYPSVKPPSFTLTCPWLTEAQLSNLTKELLQMWASNAGSVILFTWIGFLQAESLSFLDVKSPVMLSEQILQIVLDCDRTKRGRVFDRTMFCCEVCLTEKPGNACMRFLECDHVFCRACLRDFFELHIREGSINLMKCPEEKCGTQVHPTQVKELVSPELFERYDRLMFQLSLDTMHDIVYCPRKSCGSPVVVDRDNAMGSCAECHYVFCIYCRMAYHGVAMCKLKSEAAQKIRSTYMSGDESEKLELEKRYGKKQLRSLVEEHFTEQWLEEYSKKCPCCSAQVQKIDGCNKMTCSKCNSYFCWLCLNVLPKGSPYDHFNNPSSSCNNALFRGVQTQEDDDADQWDLMVI